MVKKVNAIIGFQVACAKNQTISYVIDLKNGSGLVFVNNAGKYKDFIGEKLELLYCCYDCLQELKSNTYNIKILNLKAY